MFFYIYVFFLVSPRDSRLLYISRHSLLKEENMSLRFQSSLRALKPCAIYDNLSLFAQSIGCPKRLIKTGPDQLSLKGLLQLKTLMHTHTHAYFVIL